MADAARLTVGALLLLTGTGLIYLLAVLDFTRGPRSSWFAHPLLLLPAAAACLLLGVLVVR